MNIAAEGYRLKSGLSFMTSINLFLIHISEFNGLDAKDLIPGQLEE